VNGITAGHIALPSSSKEMALATFAHAEALRQPPLALSALGLRQSLPDFSGIFALCVRRTAERCLRRKRADARRMRLVRLRAITISRGRRLLVPT
jgi:hypothetical protein